MIKEALNKKEYQELIKDINLGVELELLTDLEFHQLPKISYEEVEGISRYVLWDSSDDPEDIEYDKLIKVIKKQLKELVQKLKENKIDLSEYTEEIEKIDLLETIKDKLYNDDLVYHYDFDDGMWKVESENYGNLQDIDRYFLEDLEIDLKTKLQEMEKNIETEKLQLKLYDLVKDKSVWNQDLKHQNIYKNLKNLYEWFKKNYLDYYRRVTEKLDKAYEEAKKDVIEHFKRQAEYHRESYIDSYGEFAPESVEKVFKPYGGLLPISLDYGSWSYKNDESIYPEGIEFVSPILEYDEFVQEIPDLCNKLYDVGFRANKSCGFHVGISHEKINLIDKIIITFNEYKKKYNSLTAVVMTTNVGYKTTFRFVPDRLTNEFTKNLINELSSEIKQKIKNSDLKTLMYSSEFDISELSFEKKVDLNLQHGNYIEVRILGGYDGFEVLKDRDRLKEYLYDAINRVWSGTEVKSEKEVAKVMSQFLRIGKEEISYKKVKSGFKNLKKKSEGRIPSLYQLLGELK